MIRFSDMRKQAIQRQRKALTGLRDAWTSLARDFGSSTAVNYCQCTRDRNEYTDHFESSYP